MKGLPPWVIAVSFVASLFVPLGIALSLYRQLEHAWQQVNQRRI